MKLLEVQDEMIIAVRQMSEKGEDLSHDEWSRTLSTFNEMISQLPVADRGRIDTELFFPIEPELS